MPLAIPTCQHCGCLCKAVYTYSAEWTPFVARGGVRRLRHERVGVKGYGYRAEGRFCRKSCQDAARKVAQACA